jgi:hypothetical protein
MQLAIMAKTSLPTVQNLEAGRANPAWETMHPILESLGLTLSITYQEFNLDRLIVLGLPLFAEHTNDRFKNYLPTATALINEIFLLASAIQTSEHPESGNEKLSTALAALLLALSTHYPTLYKKYIKRSPLLASFLANATSNSNATSKGKLFKLRRVALTRLGTYL